MVFFVQKKIFHFHLALYVCSCISVINKQWNSLLLFYSSQHIYARWWLKCRRRIQNRIMIGNEWFFFSSFERKYILNTSINISTLLSFNWNSFFYTLINHNQTENILIKQTAMSKLNKMNSVVDLSTESISLTWIGKQNERKIKILEEERVERKKEHNSKKLHPVAECSWLRLVWLAHKRIE